MPQGRRPPQRQGLPARRRLDSWFFLTAKIQIKLQAAVWLEGMANKQEVGGLPKKYAARFEPRTIMCNAVTFDAFKLEDGVPHPGAKGKGGESGQLA